MNYQELCDAQADKARKEPCHRKRFQAYELARVYAMKAGISDGQLLYHLAHESAAAKAKWMESTDPDARDPELTAAMHAEHQLADAMAACEALIMLEDRIRAVVIKHFKDADFRDRVDRAVEDYRLRLLKAML